MFPRILLATDFGTTSEEAEELAIDMARSLGATCFVLPVIESTESEDNPELRGFHAATERHDREQLATVLARIEKHGVPCRGLIAVGPDWELIAETAEDEGCDLIVSGLAREDA